MVLDTPAVASSPVMLNTFTNPIIRSRDTGDPWVIFDKGFYYFTFTTGGSVEIWKARTLTGLDQGEKKVVWRAPAKGPTSRDVWAPELHRVRGKWYVYFTASTDEPGKLDQDRRQYVLEALSDDPQGAYRERGQIVVPEADCYAIDGTVFESKGKLFFVWSGREKSEGGPQNIYIAPMANPYTVSGPRVLLSTPSFDWEKHGWWVNEGPEVLQKNGKTFIVYSASGGTTPNYCLGMLTNTDGNYLKADAWQKAKTPLFQQYKGPDGEVFTPGHNGFCKSPDGKEDWIVYHAKANADNTWGGRTARAQRFHWTKDDTPFFGHPVPLSVPIAAPAGEKSEATLASGRGKGLRAEYFLGREIGTGKPHLTRTEPFIGSNAPASGLPETDYTVRWQGEIVPRFSETYTFHAYADDGVRVWVDGKLLFEDWKPQDAITSWGSMPLVAGRRYAIRVEHFNTKPGGTMQLAWASYSQPFEVVPTGCLYPAK